MLMDGAHKFVERKVRESVSARQRHWKRDFSSPAAYEQSVAANRKRFLEKIGVVDPRLSPSIESFGDDLNSAVIGETPAYRVYQVRWQVLEGVHAEGLRFEPKQTPIAQIVALADADHTPEQIAGLAPGLAPGEQFARALAECGCRVLAPVSIDRTTRWSGHPGFAPTGQTHREWIYRQAFQMGRHLIGYEVQKVLAAVDWFREKAPGLPIGVAGSGEGGLVAFYAAAADTRIAAALVSGYFNSREKVWSEPIYRNVWGLLEEFGDAELATLVAPRALVAVFGGYPEVHNHKGDLTPPSYGEVAAEFERIGKLLPSGFQQRRLVSGADHAPVEEYLTLLTGGPFRAGTVMSGPPTRGVRSTPRRGRSGKCGNSRITYKDSCASPSRSAAISTSSRLRRSSPTRPGPPRIPSLPCPPGRSSPLRTGTASISGMR